MLSGMSREVGDFFEVEWIAVGGLRPFCRSGRYCFQNRQYIFICCVYELAYHSDPTLLPRSFACGPRHPATH